MLFPQTIIAIECETGALISRVSFQCRDAAHVNERAVRHLRLCTSDAAYKGRKVSFRLYETRAATLAEIEAHFKRQLDAGAFDLVYYRNRLEFWRKLCAVKDGTP